MTYSEIYTRMKEEYAAVTGWEPEIGSDADLRLSVLAGEIYTALCRLETVRAEAFPQTAAGDALDLHAGERGLTRKPAVQAAGVLVFSREKSLDYDVEIPAGTVCASSGAAVEYGTTAAAVLEQGKTQVAVPARAVVGGRACNAQAGRIDTLVTPPVGIESVTNPEAFTGGTDAESDDALRRRLLQCYSILPNGTNCETYRRTVLEVPGISHANVVPRANGIGTVAVYIYGEGMPATDAMAAEAAARLEALREINVDVQVLHAIPVERNLAVYVQPKAGCAFPEAAALCEQALRVHFETLSVGDPFILAACTAALMGTGAIENCTWTLTAADYQAAAGEIVLPGVLSILETA